jgi:L-lactate dehydrogenase
MKIAIVGTGRVGATTAFCLMQNKDVSEILLFDRTNIKAEGLRADLAATYSQGVGKVKIAKPKDVSQADILLITTGEFGSPSGKSMWDMNKPIIEELFSKITPKKEAKIVIITTPSDRTAKLVMELTGLKSNQVIGFGGQLDLNRLKFLIHKDTNDFSRDIEAYFIGERGKRGIPLFNTKVSDRKKIIEETRNFFGLYLAKYNASTYGTARELAKLVGALISQKEATLNVSYFNSEAGIFITWPCKVSKNSLEPIKLELNEEEQAELDSLIKTRQQEE